MLLDRTQTYLMVSWWQSGQMGYRQYKLAPHW